MYSRPRFAEMLGERPAVAVREPASCAEWWKANGGGPKAAGTRRYERLLQQRTRLIDIQVARQVVTLARSVAKLSLRFASQLAHCTGFLIQSDLILTNHHSVSDPKLGEVQSVVAEFDYESVSAEKPLVVKGLVNSIQNDEECDCAVIRLERPVDREPIALGTSYDIGKEMPSLSSNIRMVGSSSLRSTCCSSSTWMSTLFNISLIRRRDPGIAGFQCQDASHRASSR